WEAGGTGVDSVSFQFLVHPLGMPGILSRFPDALDPFTWSSTTYFTLIVVLLLLRLLVPWPAHGIGRFLEELCLILPAGLLYFSVRGAEHARSSPSSARSASSSNPTCNAPSSTTPPSSISSIGSTSGPTGRSS